MRRSARVLPGFTLIEAVVYVGIMGAIVVSLVLMVGEVFKVHERTRTQYVLQDNLGFAEDRLLTNIQEAYDMVVPASGTTSTLVLLKSSSTEDNLKFALTDGQITMSAAGEVPVWLTSKEVEIQEFTVTRLSGSVESVQVILQGRLRYAEESYQHQTSLKFTAALKR